MDATVKTGPKGFFTSPAKRGAATPGITIGKLPEHIPDPYESYENWAKNERKKQQNKRKFGDFKTTAFGQQQFTPNKELYKSTEPGKGFKEYSYESAKHPKPFTYTNPIGFTINNYPDHFANVIVESPPSKKFEVPWRHTGNLGSRPTRSVTKIENQVFLS